MKDIECPYSLDHYVGDTYWSVADVEICKEICVDDPFCLGFNYYFLGPESGGPGVEGTGACYYFTGLAYPTTRASDDIDMSCYKKTPHSGKSNFSFFRSLGNTVIFSSHS